MRANHSGGLGSRPRSHELGIHGTPFPPPLQQQQQQQQQRGNGVGAQMRRSGVLSPAPVPVPMPTPAPIPHPLPSASASPSQRFQVNARPPNRKTPEPLRRAVATCLSASPHHNCSEAIRTLEDYLSNPSTIDLAYSVLLDHASAERDRSPPVVAKCVALLKRYIARYVPKTPSLQQIDSFCASLITECNSISKNKHPSALAQLANEPATSSPTFASGSLIKSLNYVHALVARHLPANSFRSARISGIWHTQSKGNHRSFNTQYGSGLMNRGELEDKETAKSVVKHILGLQGIDVEDLNYISMNLLKWRWISVKKQQAWAPSPVVTDSGGMARPRVEQIYKFAEMGAAALFLNGIEQTMRSQRGRSREFNMVDQLLQPSTVTTVTDTAAVCSHLRAVTNSKRQKTHSHPLWDMYFSAVGTWKRRPRPLFQYKHYSEQQPLRLSPAEMEEVIAGVFSEDALSGSNNATQPGKLTVDTTSDVAGSVLIKLLIDMYIADPKSAAPLTFSMLEGMLKSSIVAVRVRAFDLVLNLGVHAHLLEPMQIEEQSSIEEEPPSTSTQLANGVSLSPLARGINLAEAFRAEESVDIDTAPEDKNALKFFDKVETETPHAVGGYESWLLEILFEMLIFLVQMEEKEESVWAAALSCLLYLICDRGRILRKRLHGLDIRVLKMLLDVSWENLWAEELRSRLVCMAANLMYQSCLLSTKGGNGSKVTFDQEQFDLIGGIEFICIEYSRVRSIEARRDLFAILLDYILVEINRKLSLAERPLVESEDMQAVVTALSLADAPESVGLAFKIGLQGVGAGLLKSIEKAMTRDITSGRLNAVLLEEITRMIDSLVSIHTHPDEEFSEILSITVGSEGCGKVEESCSSHKDSAAVAHAWAVLHTLVHSSKLSDRRHGYAWLMELLSAEIFNGTKKSNVANIIALQHQFSLIGSSEKITAASSNEKVSDVVHILCSLLSSKHASVRRGFTIVLERLLLKCQQRAVEATSKWYAASNNRDDNSIEGKDIGLQDWADNILALMNSALCQIASSNDTDRINILEMCHILFSQLCVQLAMPSTVPKQSNAHLRDASTVDGRLFPYMLEMERGEKMGGDVRVMKNVSSNILRTGHRGSSSMAAMLLRGQAAAPKSLVSNIPTTLLYWPLMQLAGAATEDITLGIAVGSRGRGNTPGGASDARAALLILLIGKCTVQSSALEEVGGEEYFRILLDDADARVAYYTSAFLLKRVMMEEPDKYQRMLHILVYKAQQSNNEKLLENPYLQIRGIMQLSIDGQMPYQEG